MRFFFFLLVSFSLIQAVQAQQPTRKELEDRRAALLREIEATQEQLATTKKDRKATVGQLRALNSKLRSRQSLINNINTELHNINNDIISLTAEIGTLNKNLESLKTRYAQSIRYAYKHRQSQNMIAFLFSANDFNDGIRRMQYLKKYREYRKDQADKIRHTQAKLAAKISSLNTQRTRKGALLETEEVQKSRIEQEQEETNKMVEELKGREGELLAQIKKNQVVANKLQKAIRAEIQKVIEIARRKAAEEARKKAAAELARKQAAAEAARKKAAAEALARQEQQRREAEQQAGGSAGKTIYKAGNQTVALNTGKPEPVVVQPPGEPSKPPATSSTPSYKLSLTPEVQALSNNFEANKGRLPWPVTKGFISGRYGTHPHPVYTSVKVENNGIDIATGASAPVRAVFGGTVIKVTNIEGVVVMVSHGEFFTVYSNLAAASVRAGQQISAKQTIGTAGQNSEGDNMINFQIWKVGSNNSSYTVNPADWIAQ